LARSHAPLVLLGKPTVEPAQHSDRVIVSVCGFRELVPFVGIDNQLHGDVAAFKSVVPLDGLGHGNFAVAIADQNERRSLHSLHEMDWIRLLIDRGIVIL